MVFPSAVFDANATCAMGEAFDRACYTLHDLGQPDLIREIIARRIIEVACDGERDPNELCAQALKALGPQHSAQSLEPTPPHAASVNRRRARDPHHRRRRTAFFRHRTPVTAHAASFRDRTARAS